MDNAIFPEKRKSLWIHILLGFSVCFVLFSLVLLFIGADAGNQPYVRFLVLASSSLLLSHLASYYVRRVWLKSVMVSVSLVASVTGFVYIFWYIKSMFA